jgi:poly(hydroxyalkanoate) depolymerase family esterase
MNAEMKIDMMEATRLTREGRLEEAMLVLRKALSNPAPSPAVHDERRPRRSGPGVVAALAVTTGTRPSARLAAVGSAHHRETRSEPRIAAALGGVLDRLKQLGERGLDGLVGRAAGPGAIAVPAGARFDEQTYANEAGSRRYKLYVPTGYRGQPLPLVLMLHGCTQSPHDFAAGTRMNDLAEARIFLVAYPAQPPSANVSKCWNWFNAGDQQRDRGEPSLIAGITRQIMRDFSVEPGRVYIAGLSAGGAAAAIMGATYPDLYAAIGVHSGLACGAASDLPSAFAAMRQGPVSFGGGPDEPRRAVPTIVFHGDCDNIVNPLNGNQVIAQSKAAMDFQTTVSRGETPGGTSYTRTVHTDEGGRSILEQWVIHGLGHAWSGGSPAGSHTDPRGPDASGEIVRFFLGAQTRHTEDG